MRPQQRFCLLMSRVHEPKLAAYELLPLPLSLFLPVTVLSMLRRMVFQGNMSLGVSQILILLW